MEFHVIWLVRDKVEEALEFLDFPTDFPSDVLAVRERLQMG